MEKEINAMSAAEALRRWKISYRIYFSGQDPAQQEICGLCEDRLTELCEIAGLSISDGSFAYSNVHKFEDELFSIPDSTLPEWKLIGVLDHQAMQEWLLIKHRFIIHVP